MNWISIKDKIPPKITEVLLFGITENGRGDILLGYLDDNNQWHTTYLVYADALLNTYRWKPTHWMPLPEYPKQDIPQFTVWEPVE